VEAFNPLGVCEVGVKGVCRYGFRIGEYAAAVVFIDIAAAARCDGVVVRAFVVGIYVAVPAIVEWRP
jgi:hypothetical protein